MDSLPEGPGLIAPSIDRLFRVAAPSFPTPVPWFTAGLLLGERSHLDSHLDSHLTARAQRTHCNGQVHAMSPTRPEANRTSEANGTDAEEHVEEHVVAQLQKELTEARFCPVVFVGRAALA